MEPRNQTELTYDELMQQHFKKTDKRFTGFVLFLVAALVIGAVVLLLVKSSPASFAPIKIPAASYSSGNSSAKSTSVSGYSASSYSQPKTGTSGALAKAQSYLRTQAFSKSGLIRQLEYHGYSTSEATSAANSCGANWNEQAKKKAKSYLNTQAFSKSGLTRQLEYEGFTSSQASYGVSNCGANWNDQAAKKAKSYLKTFPKWTKSQLIKQLEYEGFTYSQASYGASHCGKSW